jgi:hypothetical protein
VVVWNKNKILFFYLFSDLRPKKITISMKEIKFLSLFLFHPPLHHPHSKYGAPKQANHEKINVFRPVSEQNFIPE